MKILSALACAALFVAAMGSQSDASAQSGRGRDRVCVYQDVQYAGWEQCYTPGDEVATLRDRNNNISSIRVYGRVRVTVYEETEFRGRSGEFDSDVADLGLRIVSGSRSWSDRIKSLRVNSDGNSFRSGTDQEELRNGICVYEDPDYRGRSQCWNAGDTAGDLARPDRWSDRVSSIRVFGRSAAILYRDIRFRGSRLVLDHDVPDLAKLSSDFGNWNDQISSLQVEAERGRGRGRR